LDVPAEWLDSAGGLIDFYELFGVSFGTDVKNIKKAYHRKMKKLHPDLNDGQTSPEVNLLNLAWGVLDSPEERARYDEIYQKIYSEKVKASTPS